MVPIKTTYEKPQGGFLALEELARVGTIGVELYEGDAAVLRELMQAIEARATVTPGGSSRPASSCATIEVSVGGARERELRDERGLATLGGGSTSVTSLMASRLRRPDAARRRATESAPRTGRSEPSRPTSPIATTDASDSASS